MVEIAKALSYDSRVLIMDEPTAALNNAEIEELFRVVRQLRAEGVGVVYISHKMDEFKRIADRVTVMRDGQYIATVPMADTAMDSLIGMMVGRALSQDVQDMPDTADNPVVLSVKGLQRGTAIRNVAFNLRKGEILGFAGLMGAGRTEVARAVFGADRRVEPRARSRCDGRKRVDPARRRTQVRARHRLPVGRPQAFWAGHRARCRDQRGAGQPAALHTRRHVPRPGRDRGFQDRARTT